MIAFSFFTTVALSLTLALCVISGKGYKTEESDVQEEA